MTNHRLHAHRPRVLRVLVGWFVILLVACGQPAPAQTPSPSPTTPSPTSTPSVSNTTPANATPTKLPVAYDLFTKGRASQVVAQLVAAAEGKPVVRLVLDRTRARLTYVDEGDRPRSVVWEAGKISPSDDGTDLVASTSFDPLRFNLSDVETLFQIAATISGSSTRQELQIIGYDHGEIYMTVTTSPESSTVFFDRDGVPVPRLDLTLADNLATGISDALVDRLLVVEVGVSGSAQVWVDVVASPGIVERRIRPANQPMYLAQRRETPSGEQFDAGLIDPQVLALLLRTAPGLLGEDPTTPVSLRVMQPAKATAPRIVVQIGSSQLVTDLSGEPLSEP